MIRKHFALGAIVAAIAVVSSGAVAEAQQVDAECTRELARSNLGNYDFQSDSVQGRIALRCREIAAGRRGIQEARARLYSGRAFNHLGGLSDSEIRQLGLGEEVDTQREAREQAIRQLEIAVNSGQDREIEGQFTRELLVARRELAQAYRVSQRRDSAQDLLSGLPQNDAGVAYQRAMLLLDQPDPYSRAQAFEALSIAYFGRSDQTLRGTATEPTGLTIAQIRRGRTLMYWLGMSLGGEVTQDGNTDEQRRASGVRAASFYRGATDAVQRACPGDSPSEPLDCGAIGGIERIGGLNAHGAPNLEELLDAPLRLGDAHLQAAGIREMEGLSNEATSLGARDCFSIESTDTGSQSHFGSATEAFQIVRRRSPPGTTALDEARWGQFCAILADVSSTGNFRQSSDLDETMAALARTDDPLILLTVARAQALFNDRVAALDTYANAIRYLPGSACPPEGAARPAANNQLASRIWLEQARTRLSYPDEPATRIRRPSSDLYVRTVTDIANALPTGLDVVERDLKCAVRLNFNNAEARLTLGSLSIRQDEPPYQDAVEYLAYFDQQAGATSEGRPVGLYLLSRRQTMIRQNDINARRDNAQAGNGELAVRLAMQAHTLAPRDDFRWQACLAQMVFRRTAESQGGARYCVATGRDERSLSLLYEGMYWLRHGQSYGRDRMSSYGRAIDAFNTGLETASNSDFAPGTVHPTVPRQELVPLLRFGQRYVLYCMNRQYEDAHNAADEVENFYKLSGIARVC